MAVQDTVNYWLCSDLLEDETLDTAVEKVARTALTAVPTADACGVLLTHNGQMVRWGPCNPVADRLEDLSAQQREGPALDAAASRAAVRSADLASDPRWPAFAAEAVELGVRACLAVPLVAPRSRVAGVLTLYASTTPFSPEAEAVAETVASEAAVVLSNVADFQRLRSVVDQLNEALESRDVIGQAKGVLMQRDGIDADHAYARLRNQSQATNQKLRDLARDVARSARNAGTKPIAR